MINLPTKDKEGNSYLSYSQINTFIKDKDEYYKRYILKEPIQENEYIKFGSKVDKAINDDDYSLFTKNEISVLKKLTRLDLFQRKTILKYDDFYIIGYIDTCNKELTMLIDYKTGGKDKEYQYLGNDYTQLCYYALSIKQETGELPKEAFVEFIRRTGNSYRGEILKVANEDPIKLSVNVSYERCKKVYNETKIIAKEIEYFYSKCK